MEEKNDKDIKKYLKDNYILRKVVFEWIPYNQFNVIKKIGNGVATAIWKDGPLYYNVCLKRYKRDSNKKVALKFINNSQDVSNEFLNKVNLYLTTSGSSPFKLLANNIEYGMSQNPNTEDYILVLNEKYFEKYCDKCGEEYTNKHYKWCKPCQIDFLKSNFTDWISRIEQIEVFIAFIKKEQFKWIPYDQLSYIKEIENIGATAILNWKSDDTDGSFKAYDSNMYLQRRLNEKVALKYLYNLQYISDMFLDKANGLKNITSYGITQNPNTKDYVLVFHKEYFEKYCIKCGEKYKAEIDGIYKWCNPCQIGFLEKNRIATAIWKDGPLESNIDLKKYRRNSNKNVVLKSFNNSQNVSDEFLNKVNRFFYNFLLGSSSFKLAHNIGHGMSQNPYTKDYILVFNEDYLEKYHKEYCKKCGETYTVEIYKWCKSCQIDFLKNNFINWTSGNKQIDDFIKKKQLQIKRSWNIIFEWIPYNQFTGIKEIENIGAIAIWKSGPLCYNSNSNMYERNLVNENVTLKYLHNEIPDIPNEFLDKIKSKGIISYGMSQNPDTKDYILVSNEKYFEKYYKTYCKKCGEKYAVEIYKWCKSCHVYYLKSNSTDWTSKIKQIETFIALIQEKQFKWIPYNQLGYIKEIENIGTTATWMNGNDLFESYERVVALKYLHNLQYISDEFLSRVKSEDICLGISQSPDTKNFIFVFYEKYFENYCDSCCNKYTNENYKWLVWKDGPLKFDECSKKYERNLNRNVALKYLYGSQNITDEFLIKVKSYLMEDISYGISQNSDTKDYILVFNEKYLETCCKNCGENYTAKIYKWCKPCQIDYLKSNFVDWTSKIKQIEAFIYILQEDQFEWIPYDQFSDIKEIGNIGATAIWKNRPLTYGFLIGQQRSVALRYLYNLQYISDEFLSMIKSKDITSYGMSQNPETKDYILIFHEDYLEKFCKDCGENYLDEINKWCKSCKIDFLKSNFISWTSENKQIDDFIQKEQFRIEKPWDIIFEWIPYNQFTDIKEIENIGAIATWKNGPKYYNSNLNKYERYLINVTLKYPYYNILDILDEFLDKMKSKDIIRYGMSQHPDTKDYILVFHEKYLEKFCKGCEQLQIENPWNIIFEWIPYNQFTGIQEIENIGAIAIWKNGPLYYNSNSNKFERNLMNENVILKYLYNTILVNILDEFLDKIKSKDIIGYGMSQNPDTKDYVLVFHEKYLEKFCKYCGENYSDETHKWCKPCQIGFLKNNFTNWTSGNKQIDDFIQKEQLQINNLWNVIFEWIPYNHFTGIKEIKNIGAIAIWNDGLLKYNSKSNKYERNSVNENVTLKYLHNIPGILDGFLDKIKLKDTLSYGMSQNPDTKDYILISHKEYFEKYCENCDEKYTDEICKWCKLCQIDCLKSNFTIWTSGDKQIDCFIQEKRLQIDSPLDIVFEWISYNQFSEIIERENGFAAALWKDGPLKFDKCSKKYVRNSNRNIALKYLYGFQYITDEFLNKVNSYLMEDISYGISQNSDTKDYILVFHEKMFENSFVYLDELENCLEEHFKKCCVKCGKEHTNEVYKWCKSCIINCKNLRIIGIIKNSSKIKWISYNQFSDIKEIGKGGFATVYSAIWNNRKVALKCLHNSQNFIYEFLNEVEAYLAYTNQKFSNILKIYGISQNSDTEEFIIVLEYAEGGNFNDYLYRNYKTFNWSNKIQILMNIIRGLKEIHQKQMVHCDFHTKNILFKHIEYINICISDMGLCREVGNIDETKIYGVMPYVAPEVLRGKPYTQAADIYSFGMIMYFIAIGRQPFADRAHDKLLALDICNEIRPEINEQRAPNCYIDLMKKCWDSNPNNRPNAVKIEEFIWLFHYSLTLSASEFKFFMKIEKEQQHYEIEKQFKEAEEYSKDNPLFIKDIQSTTHPQAIYTSRLLNHFTKDLLSECLDCEI
ncbi:uncharacterized protein OCT59_015267 [Rhizophagus irregularis]|uniref:uncharacterized protein n=1 Tax=Rhizophagus irregularis TaxID=588596 RepID=UPI00331CF13B|nr:hypothetical protein OCT59_015267 [Rhizophagus irregularis]